MDFVTVAQLHAAAARQAYAYRNWDFTLDQVCDYIASRMDRWDWGMLALDGNEDPVGYIAMTGDHIGHIFVDPKAQGQGVGNKLLTAALEQHPRPVTLHVSAQNKRALDWYLRHGFSQTGKRWDETDKEWDLLLRLD